MQATVFQWTRDGQLSWGGHRVAEQHIRLLLRGSLAALLLPLDLLHCLSRGQRPQRATVQRWALSLLALTLFGEFFWLGLNPPAEGTASCASLTVLLIAAALTAWWNGTLQGSRMARHVRKVQRSSDLYRGRGGWRHHGAGHHGHGGFYGGFYGGMRGGPLHPEGTSSAEGQGTPQQSDRGVCIHNCRDCKEPVCGRARNQEVRS